MEDIPKFWGESMCSAGTSWCFGVRELMWEAMMPSTVEKFRPEVRSVVLKDHPQRFLVPFLE